jgi:hypothetical protein
MRDVAKLSFLDFLQIKVIITQILIFSVILHVK